ncbi:hypothetical protein QZH41_002164 [Actinostola sp. cb2023]|nr:hypothetical protein QZH41_002164 [Actinostola sp. cb2023]
MASLLDLEQKGIDQVPNAVQTLVLLQTRRETVVQVINIDGVLEHHNDFLDRCLKDCMLTNPDLLKRFTQSASADFINEEPGQSPMSKKGPPPGEQEQRKTALKAEAEHMTQMMSSEDFEKTIQNFDANFSHLLLDLLERLSHYSTTDCEHQMLNIIARLDHNGFYTAQLEKRAHEGRDPDAVHYFVI